MPERTRRRAVCRRGSGRRGQGAENSKNFVSKFGRAKSYGAKTIGTPDAGAVSMACFFRGLARITLLSPRAGGI